ncbi:Fc.00g111430.m01.CDS01 [Cosmosporella sp. VM-42]
MESWHGYNYYTRDPRQWVKLMNLSTTEWGIGFLPANLYAIPDSYNDSWKFPVNATVIQHAAKTEVGSRDIEKIIFGVASGIVILWAIVWLWINRNKLPGVGDDNPNPNLRTNGNGFETASQGTSVTALTAYGENFVKAADFQNQLRYFYYESDKSELEIREKDLQAEDVTADDIEAATKLLRDMYSLDLRLFARQNSRETTQAQRNEWMCQSDAILDELNRLVATWDINMNNPQAMGVTEKERNEIAEIRDILMSIGPERYPNKQRVPDGSHRSRNGGLY